MLIFAIIFTVFIAGLLFCDREEQDAASLRPYQLAGYRHAYRELQQFGRARRPPRSFEVDARFSASTRRTVRVPAALGAPYVGARTGRFHDDVYTEIAAKLHEKRAPEGLRYNPQPASVWSVQDAESILADIRRFKGESESVTPQTAEESIAFPTREDWARWEEERENARELLPLPTQADEIRALCDNTLSNEMVESLKTWSDDDLERLCEILKRTRETFGSAKWKGVKI